MLDECPVEEEAKAQDGQQDGDHNHRGADGGRHGEKGELDPAEDNHIQREEENGHRVRQHPRRVHVPACIHYSTLNNLTRHLFCAYNEYQAISSCGDSLASPPILTTA